MLDTSQITVDGMKDMILVIMVVTTMVDTTVE